MKHLLRMWLFIEATKNATRELLRRTIFEEPFAGAPPAEPPSPTEELPVIVTRAGRRTRRTWRVEDVLPDVPGAEPELETPTDADNTGAGPTRSTTRRIVRLLVTDPMRTALDKFALRRSTNSRRGIKDIIAPYPNLSSWLFGHHYWLSGQKKTQDDREALQKIISRTDFIPSDIAGVNFKNIDAKLSINVPLTEKSTQSSRRAQVNDARRFARHEFHESVPPSSLAKTLTTDPAARDFVFDPFHLEFHDPLQDGKVERVYGELYNSDTFVNEDIRLQNSPREPGCDLPRAIMGLELWSDATQLAHFAHQKTWLAYMYFGNQSKYERARPTSKAAHHVAYFPVLPDNIHDFIKKNNGGKPTSSKVLTHCRHELFQGGLELLFDDEFVHTYKHGMVVDCIDGNALSERLKFNDILDDHSFDFHKIFAVDPLHEFELGVWKNVLVHLTRILYAHNPALIHELDRRFRQIPAFSGVRAFSDNVSGLSRIAARDYEDILQCMMPCFEGLLEEPHNDSVMSLLYTMATWHALAKMRMHTDSSLQLLDDATTAIGVHLRHFAIVTCAPFQTKETEREYLARKRDEARQSVTSTERSDSRSTEPGRRVRRFHLRTIKTHFLGDYVASIKYMGTTDSTSTQIGEQEHRRVKARYARTNKRNVDAQLVDIDIRESRMLAMSYELEEAGVDVPGRPARAQNELKPEDRYHIGVSQRNPINLDELCKQHGDDPALGHFVENLKRHVYGCLSPQQPSEDDGWRSIALQNDRIYRHETIRINFTTYDLQRDADIIHPNADKHGIIVYTPQAEGDATGRAPWTYAWVIGVYHTQAFCFPSPDTHRVDFLWERVQFQSSPGDMYGFVNPEHVIWGFHLVPAFHYGPQPSPIQSIASPTGTEWAYYYMNHFADRDLFARALGIGVGHGKLRPRQIEGIHIPPESSQTRDAAIAEVVGDDAASDEENIDEEGIDEAFIPISL
ncbi:hypothetical protein BC834DRAFT_968038 [Gloeopeniophorella convolvens]|nr:hypothetical protein BC834DRAFT_968038 [Gloeopeniophorella convolvens]